MRAIAGWPARAIAALVVLAALNTASALAQTADSRLTLGRTLTFIDGRDKPVSTADFPGQWLFVYFGYTHCADLCPLGLTVMAEAIDLIGPAARQIQPLFITVDPEHDRGEILVAFTKAFHERLLGLTGTEQQIRTAADAVGVKFTRVTQAGASTSIDHSSSYSLIDPERRMVITFRHAEAHLVAAKIVAALKAAGVPLDGVNAAFK